jgi:hypothetical protein
MYDVYELTVQALAIQPLVDFSMSGRRYSRTVSRVVQAAVRPTIDVVYRLCCTNRLEDVLALTPDGFSLRLLFGVCQER